ncbi:MAG TPA: hypothetical protein VFM18_12320, partial [Methanosarcina sp.]|nr:hypothetical protein [Methanosarcina sp.]
MEPDTLNLSQDIDNSENEIDRLLQSKNIAEKLKEEQLTKLGEQCRIGFEKDLQSRKEWEDNITTWLKLAM